MIGEYKKPPLVKPKGREKIDALRGYALVAQMKLSKVLNHQRGTGERTLLTLHKEVWESHSNKPAGWIKPYGVRTKGYASHGNGGRR